MEEVVDSSHHNVWEGPTLPFPFWVMTVIILRFFKGPKQELFLCLGDSETSTSRIV